VKACVISADKSVCFFSEHDRPWLNVLEEQ